MERKRRHYIAATGWRLISRAALLGSAGVSVALLLLQTATAQSQIPADMTPSGGVVTAGSSSIAQAPGRTTVTQTSQRTAINWQSYNVGSAATVQYHQPSSSAAALNVVIAPSPSVIAGSIKANGQIIIVNQSGVLFTRGSEVSAQSVIATTSNLSVPAFMAGRLVTTDGPRPGAAVINDGVITAGQTGLVGLIAPQVANNGLIVARLGQVVLAGADAFTLDLYGDQLMSLNVTKSVRAVDVGGKLVPALVTNRGIIVANGGKVTLTAQDADALVTQLVDAGGAIVADTVGTKTGGIAISGIGGDIKISGVLLAAGLDTGTKGGTIQAVTDGKVSVASSAIIASSGEAGGGVIALGTDATRALSGGADTTAPKARSVSVAAGAQILSDAVTSGDGGTVAVVSSDNTSTLGNISVQGGPNGGNGGSVEIASDNSIGVGGTISDASALGQGGKVLLEAPSLSVGGNVSSTVLDGLSGAITLDASQSISVADPLQIDGTSLALISGGNVSISSQVDVAGALTIDAKNSLAINGGLNASEMSLSGGNIAISAPIDPLAVLSLTSNGSIIESGAGNIEAGTLTGSALGDVVLDNTGNEIGTLGRFSAANFSLVDAENLSVAGPLQANDIDLGATAIDFEGDVTAGNLRLGSLGGISQGAGTINGGTLAGAAAGDVTLDQNGNAIGTLGAFSAANFSLVDFEALSITGPLQADDIDLSAAGINFGGDLTASNLNLASLGGIGQSSGTFSVAVLTGNAGGDVTLDQSGNAIATLGSFSSGNFSLADDEALSVAGPLHAGDVDLDAAAIDFAGNVTASNLNLASLGGISQSAGTISAGTLTGTAGGDVTLDQSGNEIAALGSFNATNFSLADADALSVTGPLDAGGIGLSAAILHFGGDVTASNLSLTAVGGIDQNAGTISAQTLSGMAGGDVTLDESGNSIGTLGSFSLPGNLLLTDASGLTIAGPVSAGNATIDAPMIDLTSVMSANDLSFNSNCPGGIVIAGVATAGNAISLNSAAGITEPGGALIAPVLSGTDSGGDVNLASGNNRISTLAGFALAGNNFVFNDPSPLAIARPVTASNAMIAAAAIDLGADITTGNLNLVSLGGVDQSAGAISVAMLTGAAGSDVTLDQSGNVIPVLGNFTANGNVSITDAVALDVTGNIGTEGNSLGLFTAGPISQTSGMISTALLNATAPAIDLLQANQIGALGNIVTDRLAVNGAGGIAGAVQVQNAVLVSSGDFNLTGSVSVANNLSVTANGNIIQPLGNFSAQNAVFTTTQPGENIILNGDDVIPGNLNFSNAGEIIHSAGSLDAGILTGTAGGLASFTGATDFGEIGSFMMSDSLFQLDNTGDLILNGPLVANEIDISTSGSLLLDGTPAGGLFFTGDEASPVATAPRPGIDSILRAASIVETGTYYLNAGPNSPLYDSNAFLGTSSTSGTIFMETAASPSTPGGNILLAASPGGLYGPAVNVVLNSGSTGFQTGNLDLYHLEVLGGKWANLSGSIDGIGGQPAAGKASAYPYPSKAYQLNGCTIGSLNCFTLGIESVPNQNPLDKYDLTHRKRRRLGKNVQLPGIATHDF